MGLYNQPMQNVVPQQYMQPVYQMSTSNKSFIEMYYYLKSQGIKNNKFMLLLYDKDLAGIDPHDPNLSLTMKMKVLREVTINYWYFLREVVRVPSTGIATGVRYKLHRGNLALNYCLLYNLNVFLELPRQQGKTLAAAVRYLYIYNFGTANSEITFMHKDMTGAKDNLKKVKDLRDMLPDYLRMDSSWNEINNKKKKLQSTVQTIQNPVNSNIIRTVPSARSATLATNLLRGRTIAIIWADEWAFCKFNDVIYVNGMPAMKTAFDNARMHNAPYGFLITTTSGIMSTAEGVYAYKMIRDATQFSEAWYDLSYQEIMEAIAANHNSNFVYIRFSYIQLGCGEKWFYEICKDMQWNMVAIRREILLEWIDTPENSPFTQDELESVRGQIHEPIQVVPIFKKYNFNIYKRIPANLNQIPISPPIIGVDVSGGYNHDYSAIAVIDSTTTELVAELKCNYISIPDLGRVLIYIVRTMMPNAVVNIERNGGFGASLIAKLKESSIRQNLYYEIKDRVIEETSDELGRPIRRKQRTKVYGLDSTHDVRDLLISILRERMERHKDKFNSPTIFDELSKMVVKRSGKVEHSDNSHDDLVFAYLMGMYVWYEGKGLRENFHINKQSIRTEDDTVDDVVGGIDKERNYTDIVEEMVMENDEATVREEVKKQLKEMQAGMGYTYKQFIEQQRKDDYNELMRMLINPVVREAYSKYSGTSEKDLTDLTISSSNSVKLPDQVFNNFNSGLEIGDPDEEKMKRNMNFKDFDPGH